MKTILAALAVAAMLTTGTVYHFNLRPSDVAAVQVTSNPTISSGQREHQTPSFNHEAHDAKLVERAQEEVRGSLKDPYSAHFYDVSVHPTQFTHDPKDGQRKRFMVCGFVNARNSFGGYVGKRPFYFSGTTGELMVIDRPDDILQRVGYANSRCGEADGFTASKK